jgi:ribose transport system substrate-binding protein
MKRWPWRIGVSCAVALFAAILTSPADAQQQPLISVIVKDQSAHFWQIVMAGAKAAGADLGVKIVLSSGTSERDVDGQIKLLRDAVANNAAAIVVAPTQYTALGPAVDEAAKHVPVVVIDSGVASLNMKSTLATDNVAAGRLAADAMADALAKRYQAASGEVAIINFLPGVETLVGRSKGFKDQLFSKYPKMTVIEEQNGDGTDASIKSIVQVILKNRPNLRGIFASNINTAQVVANAIKAANLAENIKVVGFDSSQELIDRLADGTIVGLIVQDPYRMGYEGVKTAFEVTKGRGVLQSVDTGATLITRENMNGETEKRLLSPPTD